VVWAAELTHRGQAIKMRMTSRAVLRSGRRGRKTRYRPARFSNRKRPEGWLPPSLQHRILTTMTWVNRLRRIAPITSISYESVRFDTQLMQNPNISGEEYQQGELWGYEVKQYLLDAFNYTCAYCGAKDVPLEVEHIIPKSRGGSNRVSNLTIACVSCNREKGSQTAEEYGHPEVQRRVQASLHDAAVMNSTRNELRRELEAVGLPLECGSGGRTKYNRIQQGLPKEHWVDAACIGETGESIRFSDGLQPLLVASKGHGNRQMCGTNAYGFPIRHRSREPKPRGINTGDIVRVDKPMHLKNGGVHVGRVSSARHSGQFSVKSIGENAPNINANVKYCEVIHRADGYAYGSIEKVVR
jgi:5-methylcytosine-specific restriction endonuclease McrA